MFRKLFRRPDEARVRHPAKATPLVPEQPSQSYGRQDGAPQQVFSKVFRYRLPDSEMKDPTRVEVVGSFTQWKRVPLLHAGKLDGWHVTVHHIPGNRTHHYMLLVDGKPVFDHTSDGLAIPHGPQEEQFAMPTDKGPRILMLFAQTR